MRMKKSIGLLLCATLLLSGCGRNIVEQEAESETIKDEKVVVQNYQMDETSYRLVLPFKASEARGMTVSNLNNRLDINKFEMGVMNLSKTQFSPDKYYYQEGQYLDKRTIRNWLAREMSDAEFKKAQKKDDTVENIGLNPVLVTKGKDLETANEESPLYLASILEQNYLVKKNDDQLTLSGVSIGLAMNSVHYYNQEQGYPREAEISNKEILRQGKAMAKTIVSRMRGIKGLEEVPIFVSIFKQEASSSITPGVCMATALVDKGSAEIKEWATVKENYVIFPSDEAAQSYREDTVSFNNFKSNIEKYFPNYTGVIGTGYYVDGNLTDMTITIPVQFYSQTEITGFTQYVTSLVLKYYTENIKVSVEISSASGPEAVITKERGEKKPSVYIYQ